LSSTKAHAEGQTVAASQALYVRADSDETTVVSPRTRAAAELDDLRAEATYAVDVWTGASVDVVSAATHAIEETRHEVELGGAYDAGPGRIDASYRYSYEPDYTSHGGVLGGEVDLAERATTLGLSLFGGRDAVGRSGDSAFARPLTTVGARFTFTQVLDPRTLAQVAWESTSVRGFQASPYRWVAIGGDGTCRGGAPWCLPESAPDERYRHSVAALARRALPRGVSVGGAYRFYLDSWGVVSHTLEPDVALTAPARGRLVARYRYYTQGEADFYRPRYFTLAGATYATRDRKLSAMRWHSIGVGYTLDVAVRGGEVSLGLQVTGSRIDYLAFVGLESVEALDATALIGVRWERGSRRGDAARRGSKRVTAARLGEEVP
jgi:hypothetical protein